jgi:iron complex transport system ATP-binding protein
MNSEQNILSAQNLEIGYKSSTFSKLVYGPISLNSCKGEIVAIVGRNGIGKSTLLRTLAGLQTPVSGNVIVKHSLLSELPRRQRAQSISFVPSDSVLVQNLTVKEFVALGRFPYNDWNENLSEADWNAVTTSLELVGVEHLSNCNITEISDGERHRAMIAFALAQDTDIILLDEPTAFLDISNKIEVINLLRREAQKGKTVIFTTHDLNIAFREVDTIWLMLPEVFAVGTPEELALNGSFDKLLEGTSVQFNPMLGTFATPRKPLATISLTASSEMLFVWTKFALERIGFSVETDSENEVYTLSCTTDCWQLSIKNETKAFDSLGNLCRFLKSKIELKP